MVQSRVQSVVTALTVGTLLAAVLAGCSPASVSVAPTILPSPAASSATPTPTPPPTAVPVAADPGQPPTGITLAAIDLHSQVLPVGAPERVLDIPDNPYDVGWWEDGVGVGSNYGTTVLVAHIASPTYGNGPMARAGELRIGDTATITSADGRSIDYTVESIQTYAKKALPYEELFRQSGAPRVVLVTCGGTWQPELGHWDSNVVVELVPRG